MATKRNHQNNFATNVTSNQVAGVTTTPLNSIPSVAAPFSIALDATNINGKYEIVEVTSKTATNINHAATTYAHTTDEEVRMVVGATELDEFAAKTNASDSGWVSYSTVTPTYTSADDPTYTITFAAVDLTSVMGVGMRVKFTNNSTTFYGIITAIAFSTNTVVTLYGGTDYDVANSAISDFYYSTQKAPLGFPLDPTKWTVQVTDNTERSQASPVQDTVYNLGTVTISIPIGTWDVEYKSSLYAGASANWSAQMSLSTANNSISDADFTKQCANDASSGGMFPMYCRKTLVVAVKTSYYLVEKVTNASITTLRINSSIGSDNEKTVINAICAYL